MEYYFVNKIAYINYTFPGATNTSTPVMLDL